MSLSPVRNTDAQRVVFHPVISFERIPKLVALWCFPC
jgi:hypothetical protein